MTHTLTIVPDLDDDGRIWITCTECAIIAPLGFTPDVDEIASAAAQHRANA